MKKKILKVVAFVLVACLLMGIGAVAAVNSETISALLARDIKVEYNGKTQTLKDANGKTVYPLSYQDTTYLPIRAISNILGVSVDWDEKTQTVILGKEAGKTEGTTTGSTTGTTTGSSTGTTAGKVELHNFTEAKFSSLPTLMYEGKRYRGVYFDVDDTSKYYYFGIEYSSSYDNPRIYKVIDPSNQEVKVSSASIKATSLELAKNCDAYKYSFSNKFVKKGKYKVLFNVSSNDNYEYVKVRTFYTDSQLK